MRCLLLVFAVVVVFTESDKQQGSFSWIKQDVLSLANYYVYLMRISMKKICALLKTAHMNHAPLWSERKEKGIHCCSAGCLTKTKSISCGKTSFLFLLSVQIDQERPGCLANAAINGNWRGQQGLWPADEHSGILITRKEAVPHVD